MQDFRGQGTCCHLEAIAQLLAATRISKGRSWHQTAASMHTFITVRIFIIAPLDDPRLLGSLFNKKSSHPETRLCLQRDRNDLGRARLDGFTNSFGSTGSRTDSRVLSQEPGHARRTIQLLQERVHVPSEFTQANGGEPEA